MTTPDAIEQHLLAQLKELDPATIALVKAIATAIAARP